MKTMITAGVIAALISGSALAASDRAGCGFEGEAALPKAQVSATATGDSDRVGVESEGVLTAQSDTRTIRSDENVRSGGTRTGGSGAPAPNTTGK